MNEPTTGPMPTTKEALISRAKSFRQGLDARLQEMKDHRNYLTNPNLREIHAADHEDHGEAIANHILAIRDVESAIMRLGMVLKCTGNPNPYPTSYDPSSPRVEPTADNLKL